MPHKKLIIIAVGVALIGGGVYVFLTNPPAQAPGTVLPGSNAVEYRNTDYGFVFPLPDSWKGYTIVTSTWEGYNYDGKGNQLIASGTILSIRNPLWTEKAPYQDIPIMVFTLAQWNDMNADKFHIGAAPINPSELGRNAKYVFGLPARYNFSYPAGVEEVQKIIDSKPLQTL